MSFLTSQSNILILKYPFQFAYCFCNQQIIIWYLVVLCKTFATQFSRNYSSSYSRLVKSFKTFFHESDSECSVSCFYLRIQIFIYLIFIVLVYYFSVRRCSITISDSKVHNENEPPHLKNYPNSQTPVWMNSTWAAFLNARSWAPTFEMLI